MTPFSLAMITSDAGPVAAMIVGEHCFRLTDLDPALRDTKAMLQDWEAMFPRLHALAEQAPLAGRDPAPTLLAPVLYPDSLLAVGGNISTI